MPGSLVSGRCSTATRRLANWLTCRWAGERGAMIRVSHGSVGLGRLTRSRQFGRSGHPQKIPAGSASISATNAAKSVVGLTTYGIRRAKPHGQVNAGTSRSLSPCVNVASECATPNSYTFETRSS